MCGVKQNSLVGSANHLETNMVISKNFFGFDELNGCEPPYLVLAGSSYFSPYYTTGMLLDYNQGRCEASLSKIRIKSRLWKGHTSVP